MNQKTMKSLRLILIRHGETIENASGILQGQSPGHLSGRGIEQAKRIAFRLKDEKFDVVYSSDLDRVFQTAAILMKDRSNPDIITDHRLREQNFGIYEDKPITSMLRQLKKEKIDFKAFKPKNGECYLDFYKRVKLFIEEIKVKHFGDTVVLVTHYGVISILLDILLYQNMEQISQNYITNGIVLILDMDTFGGVTIKSINN